MKKYNRNEKLYIFLSFGKYKYNFPVTKLPFFQKKNIYILI